MASEPVPMLEMKGIYKSFPGVQALSNVDFCLRAGEVHSLMGQNGAGKSTLVKVLTGVHPPDRGGIFLEGKEIKPQSPQDAQKLGIQTVYQEVNLCPNLSVAENVAIGREGSSLFIDWKEMRRTAERILGDLNIHIDVTATLSTYSIAIQQMVAIARSLSAKAKILILDEPTSSLAEDEVKMLFGVMRRLKAQGMPILFITHFLNQAFEISDRFTVLRNGQKVGEYPVVELSRMELIKKMVGREIAEEVGARAERTAARSAPSTPFLAARGLGKKGSVQGVDVDVKLGEAVGLAGLLGSGRTETAKLLFGIDKADQGAVEIDGKPARLGSPRDAILYGIGFCPEDRKSDGLVADLSIRENIILALQSKRGIFKTLSRAKQEEIAQGYIDALGIVTADAEVPISKLSGGNQQKAILARWLATNPRMLILDEPTRGIDVAAKIEIMSQVMKLCDKGMGVVFISAEIHEVIRYSDQIVVLRDRHKVADIAGADANEQKVIQAIAGVES